MEKNNADVSDGYYISPKAEVKFSGKITLPSEYNGKPIVGISDFNKQTDVTHIFWHGTPKLEIVNNYCFVFLS